MFKKILPYIFILFAINAFADDIEPVPVAASFQRIYNTPLDTTIVFTNYDEAVDYANRGATESSTAYKGQYIAVPTNGVFYIDDNWNLKEIGGRMTFFAGENVDSLETNSTPTLYFKMDYDPDHYYTSFTTLTNNDGEFPTVLIPMRGQKGADGAANLLFDGWWDKTKTYETTNTIVSYLGTAYISLQPVPSEVEITDTNYWKVLVSQGNPGSNGMAAVIRNVSATSVEYTEDADVINTGTESEAEFVFYIPRGEPGNEGPPGADLTFCSQWNSGLVPYAAKSLVRHGTNLWYTMTQTSGEPGVSEDWQLFLSDGEKGNPGSPGLTMFPNIKYIEMLSPTASPSTEIVNITETTNVNYRLKIPRGEKGDKGANGIGNMVFCGEWSSSEPSYSSNSVVHHGTNLWFTFEDVNQGVEPGAENTPWEIFLSDGSKGNEGPRGLTMFPNITTIEMLDPTNTPSTEIINITLNTNVNYKLNIPRGERGEPGIDAVYYGEWNSAREGNYPAKSMVHHGTNVWYVESEISPTVEPGSSGSAWIKFMSDGAQGNPGIQGDTIIPFAYATNVAYDYEDKLVTNQLVGLTNFFYFKIPEGKPGDPGDQGPPGAGLVYLGEFNPEATEPYASNSLVRAGTNLWWAKKDNPSGNPGTTSDWERFLSDGSKGDPGTSGDTIIPFADATNVAYGTTNDLVTNELVGLTNYFHFKIPEGKQGERGPPGADLVFYGTFNTNISYEYPTNSLVRFGTNVWYTEVVTTNTPGITDDWNIFLMDGRPAHVFVNTNVGKLLPNQKPYVTTNYPTPGNEQDIEIQFHIPQGEKGDTGTIAVGDVNTGDPGTDVIINNSGSSTAARFDFTIPRGYPGAGLSYNGQYQEGHSYLSNSLVRVNSDLWYADVDTSQTPSTNATDWSEFLTTTRFNIISNGTPLNPEQNPQIESSYDETNNIVTMKFSIPRGFKGDTKEPIPGEATNVPTRIVEGVEILGDATVNCRTNSENPNKIFFDFGIPVGLTGSQGPIGPSGTNAIITVGGVTNVPPTETNTLGEATFDVVPGENNSFALYFGIPAGITGEKGDRGDKGATLVPRGNYNATNVYYTNELVRYDTAQYYVTNDNNGAGISGLAPTNGSEYWSLFVQDGQGTAVNATTLFNYDNQGDPIYHTGNILLDTNTLVVIPTNLPGYGDFDALTVVGGVGSGEVKQWEIDVHGDMMPAEEMYAGEWDYDDRGGIMPPLDEHEHHEPTAIVQVPITASRIIDTSSGHVMLSDYIIWMDGDTAGENQTLYLDDLSTNGQTVIVRQLGDTYETTIVRGNNTYSLYGDGSSITFDWLPMKNNWYWRNY